MSSWPLFIISDLHPDVFFFYIFRAVVVIDTVIIIYYVYLEADNLLENFLFSRLRWLAVHREFFQVWT